jgi:hypothetical protein
MTRFDPIAARPVRVVEHAHVVEMAGANDINDQLTIILSAAACALDKVEFAHPARQFLLDIQQAGQVCVWKVSALLNYAARCGAKPVADPIERVILEGQKV